jgi:vancomycin permeability regulator SanA
MKTGKKRTLIWQLLLVPVIVVAIAMGALLWDGLHDDIADCDVGLVLGNTVFTNGTPSPRLAARPDRAFELYEQGRFGHILVSGARGKEGHDETVVMRG